LKIEKMSKGIQDHKLIVTMYMSRTGFKSECSCGQKLGGASGCNRSGLDYAWSALLYSFTDHLEEEEHKQKEKRRDNNECQDCRV